MSIQYVVAFMAAHLRPPIRSARHGAVDKDSCSLIFAQDIPPVPTSQEFIDIALSRTQRRLPTQIRSGFQISRIRAFYTRKVKVRSQFHATEGASDKSRAVYPGDHFREIGRDSAELSHLERHVRISQSPRGYRAHDLER